jgi:cell shape-determining protein MreD
MDDELATTNANRSYSLGATSIAIFTFMLFFLYPRFQSGEINALLFQATLVVIGVATFSFVFASLYYYGSSLGSRIDDAERARYSRRGDRFWLLGYTLLFLDPSLILFSVGLLTVGAAWLALWLVYLLFAIRYFPRVQSARMSSSRGEARAG